MRTIAILVAVAAALAAAPLSAAAPEAQTANPAGVLAGTCIRFDPSEFPPIGIDPAACLQ
jgi:hypothetical protein